MTIGSDATKPYAANMIRPWEGSGGDEVGIVSMGRGFTEVDQHLDHYQAVLAKAR